uniref:Uncharacterized protein n=1 Tax=Timema cristinae TaxID=61476 RepID=A0A7R9D375_TIMCR|nr:unnamed protein product [Timema cristinae]
MNCSQKSFYDAVIDKFIQKGDRKIALIPIKPRVLCVSGQKLAQLLRCLYSLVLGSRPLNDQVILMIVVNDLLNKMPCGPLPFMAYFSLTMEP